MKLKYERLLLLLKSYFFSGLFTLLPLTATIFFVNFTFKLIARWIAPLKSVLPSFLTQIPGSELILILVFIIMIGAILRNFVITPFIHYLERLINKLPVISSVYSASKTVVDFFNVREKATTHKKVVLVEYPQKDMYAIGFVIEEENEEYTSLIGAQAEQPHSFVKVFLPTSPNPTTGYFLIISHTKVIETDMTFEEGIKIVVSCGLITPESLKKQNVYK